MQAEAISITSAWSKRLSVAAAAADGAVDGAYLSWSMLLYGNDVVSSNETLAASSARNFAVHDLGVVDIVLLVMMALAIYAKVSEARSNKQTPHLQHISERYALVRAGLSGLKNGRHAVVNIGLLAHMSGYGSFNPIGIACGLVLAANDVSYQRRCRVREQKRLQNCRLSARLAANEISATSDLDIYRLSRKHSALGYLQSGFSGLCDGGYMAGCLLTLIWLGVGVATGGVSVIISAAIIGCYTLCSFVTKLHDEYEKQRDIEKSADEAELAELRQRHAPELEEKQALFKRKYELPPQSFVAKTCTKVGRALVTGMKNTRAAFKVIGLAFTVAVGAALALGLVVGFGWIYACYLGYKAYQNSNANHTNQCADVTTEGVNSSALCAGQACAGTVKAVSSTLLQGLFAAKQPTSVVASCASLPVIAAAA